VQGSHTYARAGSFTYSVTVRDDSSTSYDAIVLTGSATVLPNPVPPPTGTFTLAAVPVSGSEATPLANVLVATFTNADPTDPASCPTVAINWGDGSTLRPP
jgi:hypothetical protein